MNSALRETRDERQRAEKGCRGRMKEHRGEDGTNARRESNEACTRAHPPIRGLLFLGGQLVLGPASPRAQAREQR